jgi:hypothetical protein
MTKIQSVETVTIIRAMRVQDEEFSVDDFMDDCELIYSTRILINREREENARGA